MKKGGFNVPFCRKPNRFAQTLVTKISNQVDYISQIISAGSYPFINQYFKKTFKLIESTDLVYSDPPYLGRHVDYFDSWTEEDEILLNNGLIDSKAKYILSTWLSNKYRTNDYIFSVWKDCNISTKEHFYHVTANENNRNAIYEALLSNFKLKNGIKNSEMKLRITAKESQLTSKKEDYKLPIQSIMNFDKVDTVNNVL